MNKVGTVLRATRPLVLIPRGIRDGPPSSAVTIGIRPRSCDADAACACASEPAGHASACQACRDRRCVPLFQLNSVFGFGPSPPSSWQLHGDSSPSLIIV